MLQNKNFVLFIKPFLNVLWCGTFDIDIVQLILGFLDTAKHKKKIYWPWKVRKFLPWKLRKELALLMRKVVEKHYDSAKEENNSGTSKREHTFYPGQNIFWTPFSPHPTPKNI